MHKPQNTSDQNTVAPLPTAEKLPLQEMQRRHTLCRELCQKFAPKAQGMLIFSRLNIYYLTGTFAGSVLWLPIHGAPVLLVRRALKRAEAESPLQNIASFRSYKELANIVANFSSPLSETIAAEMGALPWDLAEKLQKALTSHTFMPADPILQRARAQKSPWELAKMRLAGQRHHKALYDILPKHLHVGMSERNMAHKAWEVFFSLGHGGISRMGNLGEECFLGHISIGDIGNYPSHYNGPLGLQGEHPANPYMGNSQNILEKNQLFTMDVCFMLEGYHTDKTQVYFSGKSQNIPSIAQKAHDACIAIQDRAAKALKPGAIPSEIWKDACAQAKKYGIEEGFMGLGKNKVPFLGHGIGLVIDEFPVLASRFDEPIEHGMTIAIEPKVGIKGLGMVGVENTFEITADGAKSLSGTENAIICLENI